MLRSEKQLAVKKLGNVFNEMSTVIITHYHGLRVSDISTLRNALRKQQATFWVVKNTLSKIAAEKKVGYLFKGPVAITYSNDPVGTSKILVDFTKSNEALRIVGGIIDSTVLDSSEIERVSRLSSLEELRGKIIGLLQGPAMKITGSMGASASRLIRILNMYSSKN